MAAFMATIKGQRGKASRLGTKASGIVAHVNAWNSGVDVMGTYDQLTGTIRWTVERTGGSNQGQVLNDGHRFVTLAEFTTPE